ncbi:NAD(P)-dependent oxidoreductase [Stackebrandtia nassauensis]|uniref:D-isomer specific 2-hydroxyacid dehydrogenase NAD-binding protein n=1 Tax=Stackebrandtia nassauensis (strain DSM 44728 / CIP 108903 / NRRL B-16338 / NBRC 102104 / LLR-40K-21) TaxID=446470 RepID=D3QAH0_STANL|nr:NAD(P)-dependent oxidoreductase [Stackebrandtia nassauensis]ADD42753.1 D-isomer specific 2-hydroxyacid dehydrogenase NAD-binding protein [Stackebrandtia nassauensis DSM 44728]
MWIHVVSAHPNFTLEAELRVLVERNPHWRFTIGDEPPADAGYQVLIASRPTRELLSASPRLTTVQLPFSGVPAVTREVMADFPHLELRSLHHNAGPTAELALGLVLAAARGIVPADTGMRSGDWTSRFVPPRPTMLLDGHGATVVGYGEIGRRVARGLAALGMRVRATRASVTSAYTDGDVEVRPADALTELLPDSRVLVLTVPASPATTGLIGEAELALLPVPATLVNVSRATVVDEKALYEKLRGGDLAAGLDVWWDEAIEPDAVHGVPASAYPFHELPNVVLSPHRGGAFSLPESAVLRAAHLEKALAEIASGK